MDEEVRERRGHDATLVGQQEASPPQPADGVVRFAEANAHGRGERHQALPRAECQFQSDGHVAGPEDDLSHGTLAQYFTFHET
jgi:hypothetical protein